MKTKQIETDKAPKAVGPYSQAVSFKNFIFCSGQIGLDPKTGELVNGGIEEETEQVLKNLSEVLKKAGTDFKKVLKCDIFITNISDFSKVNEIYAKYFSFNPKPARQTVEVSKLPKKAHIEIACIAFK